MVDTDALLEKDVLTLDEALKTANNAVLMALNAISILVSVSFLSFLVLRLKILLPFNSCLYCAVDRRCI